MISILHITISKTLNYPLFSSHFFVLCHQNSMLRNMDILSHQSVMSGRSLHNGHAPVDLLHH